MEAILTAFFAHPSVQGAIIIMSIAFCYGVIRFTQLGTRSTIALEGIQAGLLKQGEEHAKTRTDVAGVKTDVAGVKTDVAELKMAVKSGLETTTSQIVKAVGEEGEQTREAYRDKRLSDIAGDARSAAEEAGRARAVLDSSAGVTMEVPATPRPARTRTGSGPAVR